MSVHTTSNVEVEFDNTPMELLESILTDKGTPQNGRSLSDYFEMYKGRFSDPVELLEAVAEIIHDAIVDDSDTLEDDCRRAAELYTEDNATFYNLTLALIAELERSDAVSEILYIPTIEEVVGELKSRVPPEILYRYLKHPDGSPLNHPQMPYEMRRARVARDFARGTYTEDGEFVPSKRIVDILSHNRKGRR